jgi:hypothetical protein
MKTHLVSFQSLINGLEKISQDQHGKMLGGFSAITGATAASYDEGSNFLASCDTNTNCGTANCVAGCGTVSQ